MKRVMLDTNAYAALLAGDDVVKDALAAAADVLLPIFVVGELEAGFRGGVRYSENTAVFKRFLAQGSVRVVGAENETARIYGELKDGLKRAGTPIPANDIWIAAAAIEHAAVLITYDRHFASVRPLRLWHGLEALGR
jgi:tRNA(fMet)-specific endonuclease VapC